MKNRRKSIKDYVDFNFVSKKTLDWTKLQNENRPKCSVPNCHKNAVAYRIKNGIRIWRRSNWIKDSYPDAIDIWCCSYHHNKNTSEVNGVKTSKHLTAERQGLSITEYQNQYHPYLKHRQSYCENIDGRLGFICTFTPPTNEQLKSTGLEPNFKGWLQVDHIDGNHLNNDTNNLQTLCACCHTIKTFQYGDYATPGRKTRIKH